MSESLEAPLAGRSASAASRAPAAMDSAGPQSPADGVERLLDPRYVALASTLFRIVAGCVWAGLTLVVPFLLLAVDLPAWGNALTLAGALAVAAGTGWLSRVWPGLAYRHAAYRVGPEGIEIKRGVIWRHVITVPRSRIQHTDVSQGPVERRYGLGTLTLFTAGTEHERVDLPGLDHERALAIRDALVPPDDGDAV